MITDIEIQAIEDAIEIHKDDGVMAKNCLRLIERIKSYEKIIEGLEKQLEFAMRVVNLK